MYKIMYIFSIKYDAQLALIPSQKPTEWATFLLSLGAAKQAEGSMPTSSSKPTE